MGEIMISHRSVSSTNQQVSVGHIAINCGYLLFFLLGLLFGPLAYADAPTLQLTMTSSVATVAAGTQYTYTIQYQCASITSSCAAATVTDVLPAALSGNSADVSMVGSAQTTAATFTTSTRTAKWSFVNPLPAGSTGQLQLSVKFPTGITANGATAVNSASMSATGATTVTSNAVTVTATSTNAWTLSKTRLSGGTGAALSQDVVYQIQACPNSSNVNLANVIVTDTLPVGATFVSASNSGSYASGIVTWNIGAPTAAAGCNTVYLDIQYPSSAFSVGQTVTNTATLTGSVPVVSGSGSITPLTASISHSLSAAAPNKTVTKKVSNSTPLVGQSVTYDFDTTNTGNVALNNFSIVDNIPPQLSVTQINSGYSYYNITPTLAIEYQTNTNLNWTPVKGFPLTLGSSSTNVAVSSLNLGTGVNITALRYTYLTLPTAFKATGSSMGPGFVATLLATDWNGNTVSPGNIITNTGAYSYSYNGTPGNGTSTVTLTVAQPSTQTTDPNAVPKLDKVVSGTSTVLPGSTVTYQLTLNNASNAGSALINPVLGDLLDPGLTYVANSATVSTRPTGMPNPTVETLANYNNTGRTLLRFRWDGASAYSLPPNTSAVLKFNVTVNTGTLPGSIANVADLLSYGNSAITTSSCNTPMPVDTYDLNANGNKTETLCASKSSGATITVGITAAMQSVMLVKGQLDANNRQYPSNGTTVAGGSLLYTLQVSNVGNVPMTHTQVIDILPYVGDTGVLDPQNRLSAWRPNLTAPVVAPAGVIVYYSNQTNPCRTELSYSPAGCTSPNWSTNPPADITTVQALKFDFGSIVVNPLDMLQLSWPMRAPIGAPTTGAVAWNSFGYVATRADNSVALLPSEPNKVGVAVQPPTPPVYSGFVWLDSNGNGLQDPAETGLNGVRVDLYQSNGVQVDSTITTSNGSGNPGYYQFSNLVPGNFYVLFYPPVGYGVTKENAGSNAALNSAVDPSSNTTSVTALTWGQTYSNGNMGLQVSTTGSIGNYVWFDRNGNGIQDESTADGINGVVVKAYSTSNPNTPAATTVTANDVNNNPGFYQIKGLAPGTYYLVFTKPSGATFTLQDVSGSDQLDSDANASTGQTATFSLVAGQYDASWDAGIILPTGTASLGEWVWLDTNNNGVYEPFGGEPGISNVRVNLYEDTDGNGVFTPGIDQYYSTSTTYTSGGYPGYYSFTGLPAGAFIVQIDPMNFVSGQPLAGLIASTSITNPNSGQLNGNAGYLLSGYGAVSKAVTLSISPVLTDDFGFTATYSIGNRVFRDDGTGGGVVDDGIQNGGEPGIAGVAVDVYLSAGGSPSGAPVASAQTTDASGYYRFDGLPAGNYVVVVNQSGSPVLNGLVSSSGYSSNFALAGDLTDHGIDTPLTQGSVLPGGIASLPVTLAVGGQPLGENLGLTAYGLDGPNGDGSDNLVVDFGFTPSYSLGNRVFRDDGTGGGAVNNGKQDGGEPGIAGVSVKLFQSNASGVPTGSQLAAQVTDTNGYYRFDGLAAGNYVLIVDQAGSPVLSQMFNSTGSSSNFGLAGDLLDHGIDTPMAKGTVVPGGIMTAMASLGAGSEPTGEAIGSSGAGLNGPNTDAADNLVGDFGFVPTFSLGNRIWMDNGAGNGTANDGILNGGEPAVPAGVVVELLDSTGVNVLATTATDVGGYYRFDGLNAGTYTIRVADANFASGGLLAGYKLSAGYFPDVSAITGNNHNHGQTVGGHVVSPAVTLGVSNPIGDVDGSQPTAAAKNGPNGDAYDNLLVDFGFTPVYSLGNRLWIDNGAGGGVANDGILNGTEPPVSAGVTVELLDGTATNLIASTTTDASGYYRFDQLVGGSYVVRIADANFIVGGKLLGYSPSIGYFSDVSSSGQTANNRNHGHSTNNHVTSQVVTLGLSNPTGEVDAVQPTSASQNGATGDVGDNLLVDFGFTPAYSLGDYVWFDTNQDGIQQPDERGIAGVTVNLYAGDGVTLLHTSQTDGSGNYLFEGLAGGNYVIGFVKPAGYQFSPQNQGTGTLQDSFDSDADVNTGKTAIVTLSGAKSPTNDAGLYLSNGAKPANIIDWVWYDTNRDGLQSTGENGLAGVTVNLWDGGHTKVLASTVSDGQGGYEFTGLAAGTYTVQFVLPTGYSFTVYETGNGSHSGSDSEAAVATGLTTPITLSAGQNLTTVDAGLYLTGTNTGTNGAIIGNKVWYDTNNNGVQDAGEPGVPGVTVFLYAAHGVTWLAETQTDATGAYGFGGLATGAYNLEFLQFNSLYTFSPQSQGASITLDSDADQTNGWVGGVTVNAGQTRSDVDVGMVIANALPLSAGNSVWLDGNHNFQFDSGEGLANAQVVLYDGLGDEMARLSSTAADANYLFTGLGQGSYRVEINKTSLPVNASEIADPDAVLDSTTDLVNLAANLTTVDFGYSTLIDFGDLPNSYATLLGNNGPRHGISGIYLGAGITDAESDGQPMADASGDNTNGSTPNDEQGVSMTDLWVSGQNAVIKVTASAAGVLSAWADWNNNGAFDANENFISGQALTAGLNSLTVALPASAVAGQVAVRFRATNATGQGGESPTGQASNGEVEDYFTTLYAPNMVGSIAGEVRNDTKGDGNLAAGYAGLAGATVGLYTDPNGDGNPSDGTLQASIVTDSSGLYSFVKLLPGNYVVMETNPITVPVFVSTNDAVGTNNDLIPVVLASGNLTVTGRDFLDYQIPPIGTTSGTGNMTPASGGGLISGAGGSGSSGGSGGPVVSIPLTDGVSSPQCAGSINLLKNATAQQLEGLRENNGGQLVFGFTLDEANSGSENAQSEGVALNESLTSLTLTFNDGSQQSYSITNGSCQTETYSLLTPAGGTTRNPTYTLIGNEPTDIWRGGAQNAIQNTVDSTLQCNISASLGSVTAATLNVNFLQTDVALGDPEAFYDCTGPTQLTLLNAADTLFVDNYAPGQALAPAMALTNPAQAPDPMAVVSWNSFPSSGTYYIAAYEDQYNLYKNGTPATDYDFNDAVVAYQVKFGLNSSNQVVQIAGNAYLLARGAAYSHDWHLRIGLPSAVSTTATCTTTLNTSPQTSFGCNAKDLNPAAYPILSSGTVDVVVFGNTLSIFPNTEHTDYRKTFTNTLWGDTYLQGPRSSFTINLNQPTDLAKIAAAPFDPYLYVWNTKQSVQLYQVNPAITDNQGNPYGLLIPSGWRWSYEQQDVRTAYPKLSGFIGSQGTSLVNWYSSPKTNLVFPLPAGWDW